MASGGKRSPRHLDRRHLPVGAVVLGAMAVAAILIDRDPGGVPALSMVAPTAASVACTPISLSRNDGTGVTDLRRVQLFSNNYLLAHLCEPTFVSLTAEGSEVDGVGARLSISLGTDNLFDDAVTGSVKVEVVADPPGWLIIAFTNDLYRPPADRNLTLTDIELTPLTSRRVDEP